MAEKPIIFTGESVRAILAGTKTQTRRVMDRRRYEWWQSWGGELSGDGWPVGEDDHGQHCAMQPPHEVGDILWVRETWSTILESSLTDSERIVYRADCEINRQVWRSPMFMPRWASRITLEVTDVRCRRVQDISEEDALAEGVMATEFWTPDLASPCRAAFRKLWDSINAKRGLGWDSNPWVFAYSFRRLEAPHV